MFKKEVKQLEPQIQKFKAYTLNDLTKFNLKEKPNTQVDVVSGRHGGYKLTEIKNELVEEGKQRYLWKKKGFKGTYPVKLIQFHNGGVPRKGNEKGEYAKWAFKIPIFKEPK